MSLDAGDVDNDGLFELFSTDMMPIDDAPETVAAWDPLMADMVDPIDPADPQIMSNVLQVATGEAGDQNAARPRGVEHDRLELVGQIRRSGSGRAARSVRGQRDDRVDDDGASAQPRVGRAQPGNAQRRRRLFPAGAGVAARLNRLRPRHEHGRPGWRRRPRYRREQPACTGSAFREPAVRRPKPARQPALAGQPQYASESAPSLRS